MPQSTTRPDAAGLRLRGHPGFRRFWTASTVSGFGSYVTTLAVGVPSVANDAATWTSGRSVPGSPRR